MESDLTNRLEKLEKEVADLKKESLSMFGRTYSQVGDSSQDLVLNTRGQVKIKYGNKFIDLIKNGSINVDTQFIFTANDSDSIGSKDGIYILDDKSTYLKYKGETINLSEVGVSFSENQESSPEQKLNALRNIGFYCTEFNENSVQNGIIYLESDQKLYYVKDGVLIDISDDNINVNKNG